MTVKFYHVHVSFYIKFRGITLKAILHIIINNRMIHWDILFDADPPILSIGMILSYVQDIS